MPPSSREYDAPLRAQRLLVAWDLIYIGQAEITPLFLMAVASKSREAFTRMPARHSRERGGVHSLTYLIQSRFI